MTSPNSRPASYARHYDSAPQLVEANGSRTWLTRGANFVIAYSDVKAGTALSRDNNPDEYMLFMPTEAASVHAGSQQGEAAADSLTIVPPGASSVTAHADCFLVRVFSNRAEDLLHQSGNHAAYADGAPDVAPLVPWPDPPAGFKLRSYRLADYVKPGDNMRVFRSTNLMINMLAIRKVARDTRTLSPHVHSDFEQGSLAIGGSYVHHCRYPWGKDLSTWREDEHVEIGSPSVMVIPPKVIHTSCNIGTQPGWLVDIFAPPRMDFSLTPGMVCNADEYPMPGA